MSRALRTFLLLALAGILGSLPLFADSVTYTLESSSPSGFRANFSFSRPELITTSQFVSANAITSCEVVYYSFSYTCYGIDVVTPALEGDHFYLMFCVDSGCTNLQAPEFYFSPQASFSTLGTHQVWSPSVSVSQGTLTVSSNADPPSQVPEPSTVLLLGTGAAAFGRRLAGR